MENNNQHTYLNEKSNYQISDKVIAKIAKKVLDKTDGVLELQGNILSSITDTFADGQSTAGISIDLDENKNAIVNTKIILEYGKKAPEVFAQLDKNIKAEVRNLTGINVVAVKAEIVDLLTREEYNKKKQNEKNL